MPHSTKQLKRESNYINRITPSFLELGWSFFLIGLTAYSMAMLQQLKALIMKKSWLSQNEIDEGLAMVQLYPGPIFFNLATYCAYRIKGFIGAFIATSLFILPSYLLMLFLSWLYFNYGNIPWVHPLFLAIEAMVVGIVLHISIDFAKRYIQGAKSASLAGLAFILMLFHINAFWIILIAIFLGVTLFWKEDQKTQNNNQISVPLPGKFKWRLIGIVISGTLLAILLAIGFLGDTQESKLLFSMSKVGAVAFGNGMTIMPLLQQEVVSTHHWLNLKEFADGIAFGQITPGPFLITATFIGYKIAGVLGSALATIGIFYPSFFYTILMSEIYEKIKGNHLIQKALLGILATFTGMIFFVVLTLGKVSLISPASYIWAVGALIGVRYFQLNIIWIFLLGIITKLVLYFIVFPI